MTAFWNIAPCCLVEVDDVSEVHTASNIRAMNKPQAKDQLEIQGLVRPQVSWPCQWRKGDDDEAMKECEEVRQWLKGAGQSQERR
jgi:hypothetical protein